MRGLPALARRKVGVEPLLPREVDDKLVPPAWRRAVHANPSLPQGAVDRDAYVVCVQEQPHRAPNNRDVSAAPSHRWSNPRARLLDVQESRHKPARDVCHGRCGTSHQADRDGMEDQLGALGLVLNAIVLWTTKYIDAAVAQLRAEGHAIRDEDIARLSPLKHRSPNPLGRYSFTASAPAAGALRPLRAPDAPELDEDEDETTADL